MNYQNIITANATLIAEAEHLEELAKFYAAEAEKMLGVAKNLRELAKPEGAPSDPKVALPKTATALARVGGVVGAVSSQDAASHSQGRRPAVEAIAAALDDQSFDRPAVGRL